MTAPAVGRVLAAAVLVRQAAVLRGALRARRFLARTDRAAPTDRVGDAPEFALVVPVLREARLLAETVAHLRALPSTRPTTVVVVTTAREQAEDPTVSGSATHDAARALARDGACVHLHDPDPYGLKGDQLNLAARVLGDGRPDLFLVFYDADSRPEPQSLLAFECAVTARPDAHVFHQSSRFVAPDGTARERPGDHERRRRRQPALAGAAAVRANRFVLGFELPRLLARDPAAGPVRRRLAAPVYAHVTGHGLCVRAALLEELPFARRSPMEDMRFSFHACARGLELVPVPSLDTAEVPPTTAAQARQAARWFAGPARATEYLRDGTTPPGWRSRALAVSALGSAAEWLLCAVAPAGTVAVLVRGTPGARAVAAAVAVMYLAQAVLADAVLGGPAPLRARAVRVALSPVAMTVFGVGGWAGAVRLVAGDVPAGKTERF